MTLEAIQAELETATPGADCLLRLGERILEQWLIAHGETPTEERREGFRLLALHRQGARDDASFNACRETCRELVYHYNLLTSSPEEADAQLLQMMRFIARHLYFFVSGKLQEAGLGDFCCASRPLRRAEA